MASLSKTALSTLAGLLLGLACSSGSDSQDQSPQCAEYVECASALSPDTAMALEDAYGPDGTCWSSQGNADACTATCESQLMMLQADNPGEPACAAESADATTSG
jgi:hypothetical protein